MAKKTLFIALVACLLVGLGCSKEELSPPFDELKEGDQVQVVLTDGTKYEGKIVGVDEDKIELVVRKVIEKGTNPLELSFGPNAIEKDRIEAIFR